MILCYHDSSVLEVISLDIIHLSDLHFGDSQALFNEDELSGALCSYITGNTDEPIIILSGDDLDQSQFSYWKRKFNRVNSVTKSVTSKFTLAQVQTITEQVSSSLTLTLPSGAQLEGINEHNAHCGSYAGLTS
ncbi:IS66 family insertion sequence element accessory protein TnpA [Vibrio metschnikovii]|uniref:IS66 family insertion sequence element accessory protein TnpA n=1 Tax=Vibrio metschnikovii TaxID=28172 RepID=UPI003A7F3434